MKYTLKTITIVMFFLCQSIFGQTSTLDKQTIKELDSLFEAHHQNDKRGSIVSIIKDEEVIYTNASGLANIEHQIPINNSTTFNIASNSKQFTIFLALLLEEEGKLSLEDDISLYLPELKDLPYRITIKQLANHTHGLSNPDEIAKLKGEKFMHHGQVVTMLLGNKLVDFEPGEKLIYNNTGFIILSEIIERVENKPFTEQLQERIFKPLGMNSTKAVAYTDDVVINKAYAYDKLSNTYINFPVELSTIGSSGIYTTINDLTLWAKNYQNVKLGKPEFYKKMQELTILNSGRATNYGLGLQVDRYKGIDIVFHGGGTESYRSYILHAPKHQLSLLYLSNKGGLTGLDIMYKSLELLLKKNVQEKETFKVLNNDELKNFEGTYQMFPGVYYNIIAENGKLYFQDFGATEKLYLPQTGENEFDYPIPYFKFVFYENEFYYHMADMTYACKKVKPLEIPNAIDLNKYVGFYKSAILDTIYELYIKDDKLFTKHPTFNEIALFPLSTISFYSKQSFFAKIDFNTKANGTVESLKVSGQNLKDIVFEKIIK
ncbi:MAG: serine hydrolase domain-containing protein [Winogradskyella sp.]|uniref:serine hydrolase domain-containing protein n=1 Tax=Winogradskyella sp. TaxID=1883156 RepID=UPI00385B5C1D